MMHSTKHWYKNMYNHFPTLQKYLPQLQDNKDNILKEWISTNDVKVTLEKNQIQPTFFAKHFGSKVINYALNVIDEKEELGDCPVIGVMLIFFQENRVPLSDIYLICSNLKTNLMQYLLEQNILTKDSLVEITMLMDKNFMGVIDEYINIYYTKNEKSKNQEFTPTVENLTNAKTYLSEIDLDSSLIEELNELEIETHNSLEKYETIEESLIYEIINIFKQYSKVLKDMVEFQELSYAIILLTNLIEKTDILKLETTTQQNIILYIKSILEDLGNWRNNVFIQQSAKDIHYLDKTLLSSIAQLQILLMPSSQEELCEMEFF